MRTLRVRQFLNTLRYGDRGDRYRNLLLVLVFAGFMVSLAYLFSKLFLRFLTIPLLGRYVMLQTLSLIFLSFFVLLYFSSMVTALGTLYMSRDLPLLFSSPTDGSDVYWVKTLEGFLHAGWMVLVFGYPVLVSFGYSTGASWLFYPVALLLFLPFLVVPYCLGNLTVTTILYWVPVRRARSVLIGIAIVFGFLMVYVLRLLRPRLLFEPELARDTFVNFLTSFRIGAQTGLPSYHAAYALHFMTQGKYSSLVYHGSILVGLALASIALMGWLGQRWYSSSWLRTQEGRPGQNRVVDLNFSRDLLGWIPRPYRGLTRVELLRFLRHTTQWSQMLVLMGIVVVHLSNLLELPASRPFLNHVIYFVNLGLIGFVMTALCVRFVFPSISFEGDAFWVIRTAPVSMTQYFLHKTLFYLVPVALLGGGLIMLTNAFLAIGWTLWLGSVVLVVVMSVTLTAGGLAFGSLFPVFDYDHFGEVITSSGSVFYMLCGMFYVGGAVAVSVLPIYNEATSFGSDPVSTGLEDLFLQGVLGVAGGSIVLTVVLLVVASRAVRSYEFASL